MDQLITSHSTIAETSIDAKLVYELLKRANVGETITYDQMSDAIGRDIRRHFGALMTARRMAIRNDRMVFGTVRTVGIKRLSDIETVDSAERTFSHIRRTVRREAQRQSTVDIGALPREYQTKYYSGISYLGTLAEFAKPATQDKIEKSEPTGILPVGKVLEFFK